MDIKITFERPMTLNERFAKLCHEIPSLDEDNFDHIEIFNQKLNLDTLLPPRPLIDEDNFDDDHIEIFDKQLLEEELNEIEKDIFLNYCK